MRRGCVRDHRHDRNLHILQVVQALLGRPRIEGALAWLQCKVRIEGDTRIRVVDANRRMIHAERNLAGRWKFILPCRRRIVLRELQQFERVPVRIAKLEGLNAAR